jgi:hypothetical protein
MREEMLIAALGMVVCGTLIRQAPWNLVCSICLASLLKMKRAPAWIDFDELKAACFDARLYSRIAHHLL